MKRETAKRLLDAELACVEAIEMYQASTRDLFLNDRKPQLAVQKLVEIAGEALRQAEDSDHETVRSIPELRAVVNTRNRLVHGYDTVDFGALWDIVERRVPALRDRLHTLLIPFPPSYFGNEPTEPA